jgi:predicted DNA-binding WGR domain protein
LLKDIEDQLIKDFDQQIKNMEAFEKKIRQQQQRRFNPRGQEFAINPNLSTSAVITTNNQSSLWQNFSLS